MPFAEVNDIRMFYTDEGSGSPVLFVHGWTCDSLDWSWQLDAFTASHRVIAVDLRSHGRTSLGGTNGDHTAQRYAGDLAALLAQLDTGPVVAVGHSLGGVVVSALAVEHPSLVRALVPVDPGYGVDGELIGVVEEVVRRLDGPGRYEAVATAFAGLEGFEVSPALVTLHRRRACGMAPQVIKETFVDQFFAEDQFALQPRSDEYLSKRSCPVLSVWSDVARGEWEPQTFQDPYSRAVVWAGVGHWLHQVRPDDFNALVLDWIDGLPTAGAEALAESIRRS